MTVFNCTFGHFRYTVEGIQFIIIAVISEYFPFPFSAVKDFIWKILCFCLDFLSPSVWQHGHWFVADVGCVMFAGGSTITGSISSTSNPVFEVRPESGWGSGGGLTSCDVVVLPLFVADVCWACVEDVPRYSYKFLSDYGSFVDPLDLAGWAK